MLRYEDAAPALNHVFCGEKKAGISLFVRRKCVKASCQHVRFHKRDIPNCEVRGSGHLKDGVPNVDVRV